MLPFVTFVTFGLYHSRFLCFWGLRCVAPAFATLSRVPFAGAHSQSAAEGYRVLKATECARLLLWGAEGYAASSLALASSYRTATGYAYLRLWGFVRPRQSCDTALKVGACGRFHGTHWWG